MSYIVLDLTDAYNDTGSLTYYPDQEGLLVTIHAQDGPALSLDLTDSEVHKLRDFLNEHFPV